MIQVCIN